MMDFINTFIALLNEMSPYLLLGFLIAGILHAFVPAQLYSRHLSGSDMKSYRSRIQRPPTFVSFESRCVHLPSGR